MRTCEGKTKVIVHDYLDVNVPILVAQYNKRRVAYRQMGFTQAPG